MCANFLGKDLIGIVDGSEPKPPSSVDSAVKADWRNVTIKPLACYVRLLTKACSKML